MFELLNHIDWDLLHQQKSTLLAIRTRQRDGSPEFEALSGIIHLLDALQDDAVADPGTSRPRYMRPKGTRKSSTLRSTQWNPWSSHTPAQEST